MGKLKGNYGRDLSGEVLIEPLELGSPGAYVARVASRVLTSEELSELKGHREECQNSDKGKIGTYGQCEDDRVKTGQQDKARYCILKVLNTRGQYLELGKNVPVGQAEPLRRTPSTGAGIDFRSTGLRDMAAHRISSDWKKFPGTEGKAQSVRREVGTPLTNREAYHIVCLSLMII
jgi:hypothetical protein